MHPIATANRAGFHDVRIHSCARQLTEIAKVAQVMFGDRAQNPWIVRQIGLRQYHIDASRTRDRDAQDHLFANRDHPADPRVLDKWLCL